MWITYCLMGWLLIATKRYMNKQWLLGQVLHSFCAYFMTATSVVWTVQNKDSQFSSETYKNFTIVLTAITCFVTWQGMAGAGLGRFKTPAPWLHHKEKQNKLY